MARRYKNRHTPATIAEIKYASIESIDQEGRGVTHVEGKTIFIEGALPGEKVSFKSKKPIKMEINSRTTAR